MNLLKMLLPTRNSENRTADAIMPPATGLPTASVAQDLFVELEEPKPSSHAPQPSRLKQLADQDLTEAGRQAGYDYHDPDMCRTLVDRYKAELLRALDHEIERIATSNDRLDMDLRRLSGEQAMSSTYRALEAQKEMLERQRLNLQEQHMLVVGGRGYAELPIASFTAGYQQGYAAYLQETHFLSHYLA